METIKRMHGETSNTYLAEKLMKILQNKYSKFLFMLLDVEYTVIRLHTMVNLFFSFDFSFATSYQDTLFMFTCFKSDWQQKLP